MKKLIPALCMLLIAAALLGTSTYAWFSMNDKVTATGMTVTAKSDSIFLEITGTQDAGVYSTTGTNAVDAKLYPVAHESWTAKANIEDFDLNDDDTLDNWYYQSSASSDSAMASGAKTYIDAFGDYVAKTTYTVRLRPGTAETAYDLYVSSITIPVNTGITVVVAGATGYKEFTASSSTISFAAEDVLSDTVTLSEQTITVYIYIDGHNTNVFSDNIANLTGAVEFELTVFDADQNALV